MFMTRRWLRVVGIVLLCVYAAAIVHQLAPHHREHGDGDTCSLCLMLSGAAVTALGILLLFEQLFSAPLTPSRGRGYSRHVHEPFSLRGPPSLSF